MTYKSIGLLSGLWTCVIVCKEVTVKIGWIVFWKVKKLLPFLVIVRVKHVNTNFNLLSYCYYIIKKWTYENWPALYSSLSHIYVCCMSVATVSKDVR